MRELLGLAASFSLACICAELVSLMTDAGWTRRCIKAAAGLYILVVLLGHCGALPALMTQELPQQSQPDFGETSESFVLSGAAAKLEQTLSDQCQEQFGVSPQIEITLQKGEDNDVSAQTEIFLPPDTPETVRSQIFDWLEQELETKPDWREEPLT